MFSYSQPRRDTIKTKIIGCTCKEKNAILNVKLWKERKIKALTSLHPPTTWCQTERRNPPKPRKSHLGKYSHPWCDSICIMLQQKPPPHQDWSHVGKFSQPWCETSSPLLNALEKLRQNRIDHCLILY